MWEKIRGKVTAVSFLIFLISFAVYIIGLLVGACSGILWTIPTSLISFTVMIVAAGDPSNEDYLELCRRRRRRR